MKKGLAAVADLSQEPPQGIHARLPSPSLPFFNQQDPTTNLNAWTSYWTQESQEPLPSTQLPCGHAHAFSFLKGDLVLMGGFYGSHLKNTTTQIRDWLSMELILGIKKGNVSLPLDLLLGKELDHVPDGILSRIGPVDVCSRLVKELVDWEQCAQGSFRFHQFSYDWRRDGQTLSRDLESFLESIYRQNGQQPISILARTFRMLTF